MPGDSRVVLIVVTGCEACHEFRPTFEAVAADFPDVQTRMYDAANRRVWPLLDHLDVEATPTTLVIAEGREVARRSGALSRRQLESLFRRAR